MTFHIITLFPDSLRTYLDASIIGRARRKGKIYVELYNPRAFTSDKHARVDRKPYAGGPGMVLQAEPVIHAVEKARGRKKDVKIILFNKSGKQFTSAYAKNLTKRYKHVIMVAGHYEGVDARAKKALGAEEVSIGPYVLTGGELPALIVVDAVARYIPGVLGKHASLEEERTASSEVYTRPEVLTHKGKNYRVPKVLLSGDHKKIEEWRRKHR